MLNTNVSLSRMHLRFQVCIHIDSYRIHITYIHNWPLQPFSQDYGLIPTPLMLCILILFNFFHDNFIFIQSFCQKSADRKSPKKYFSFWCLTKDTNSGLTSNKPTNYLLDYSDFNRIRISLEIISFLNKWFFSLQYPVIVA